ncbi:MAG: sigma-54 interaction domain-containing protein [Cryomorphaceae bacterium]|nr:sigma-54 dependent transcriptional regulator [Flavobacteriales bacterium]
MDIQQIKQRFGIIGNNPSLNRAIDIAMQVAPTDISVLISGESGTGKETMPQIIHQLSARKHGSYIAVNCGAIPEGTIDSELFGHEKGAFTGAHESRKGYFEVADGGTIFLDEVGELPLQTQVRLLRVLETGEFIRVGSSKMIKTDVRIIAASNVDMSKAIQQNKFREDLFYRLCSVPISLPPLRERKEDIQLLFRKFAVDFAEKYRMPSIRLDEEAKSLLENYAWPGNIRQLKNITEQLSVIEEGRTITRQILNKYLPEISKSNLPALVSQKESSGDFTEREILYKVLFEMRQDVSDLKSIVLELMQNRATNGQVSSSNPKAIKRLYEDFEAEEESPETPAVIPTESKPAYNIIRRDSPDHIDEHEEVEESLSIEDSERELIQRALKKHNSRRKQAARELGISERTLYRKIKEYDLR